ncbi:30S ribosomal protein S7 [bacterium HR29]|jgi:small subunit ribosomal protein S7|nr:30S ribosomal protein S7 [bacterium HR29]
MPRRYKPEKRQIPPDPRYNSVLVQVMINKIMRNGKKSVAEKILYRAFDRIRERTGRDPLDVFQQAIRNVTPVLEVKPRRVGGATYQVPVEIRPDRRLSLAMRWIIHAARARKGRPMFERLADELLDAANNTGAAVKRRDDTHRMAEANRAFVHYRW